MKNCNPVLELPQTTHHFEKAIKLDAIQKRDEQVVPFDAGKITLAIQRAGEAAGEFDSSTAQTLTIRVLTVLTAVSTDAIPTVEKVQDIVEEVLLSSPFKKIGKGLYSLSRPTCKNPRHGCPE